VFVASWIISALLHTLVLGAKVRGPPTRAPPSTPARSPLPGTWGLRVIPVVEPAVSEALPGPGAATADEPDLPERLVEGDLSFPAAVGPARPDADPATPPVPAEAFRPRAGDPRLWRELPAGRPDASGGRIQPLRAIDAYNSLRIGLQTADGWAYGTWVDEGDGGARWGAAPGVIFVAGVAIPVCRGRTDASECGFGLPPIRREEYKRRLQALVEIRRQRHWGEIRDRADSIRKRRNAERDSIRGPGSPTEEASQQRPPLPRRNRGP
jgi:hypothetical protein